jgi:hypothetical protein
LEDWVLVLEFAVAKLVVFRFCFRYDFGFRFDFGFGSGLWIRNGVLLVVVGCCCCGGGGGGVLVVALFLNGIFDEF